jgi:hypothetical protein
MLLEFERQVQEADPGRPKCKLITAEDLEKIEFTDPTWIVPEILPAGLAILAGKPKLGKSWLALNISLSVALGGWALDRMIVPGTAIYFGLEDTERRLQSRLKLMMNGDPLPAKLLLSTAILRTHEGGLEALEEVIQKYRPKLVVIDTLARFRPPAKRNDGYQSDTDQIAVIKNLADKYESCVLLVHHLRKSGAEDPLDEISGTTGISGAADSLMVLKRARGGSNAELLSVGRDYEEIRLALKFASDLGVWQVLGSAEEVALSHSRKEIIDLLRDSKDLTPTQIATELGKNRNTTRRLLSLMLSTGALTRNEGGKYSVS